MSICDFSKNYIGNIPYGESRMKFAFTTFPRPFLDTSFKTFVIPDYLENSPSKIYKFLIQEYDVEFYDSCYFRILEREIFKFKSGEIATGKEVANLIDFLYFNGHITTQFLMQKF